MIQEISLEPQSRGHANLKNGKMTIFVSTLTSILRKTPSYFPFPSIESLIEELTIHECIHEIVGASPDWYIDAWHIVNCRLINRREDCNCPIDCYFRDVLCNVALYERG